MADGFCIRRMSPLMVVTTIASYYSTNVSFAVKHCIYSYGGSNKVGFISWSLKVC